MRQLKDYRITTVIKIHEWREKFTDGKGMYKQPFKCYGYELRYSDGGCITMGGIKTKKELLKEIAKEMK